MASAAAAATDDRAILDVLSSLEVRLARIEDKLQSMPVETNALLKVEDLHHNGIADDSHLRTPNRLATRSQWKAIMNSTRLTRNMSTVDITGGSAHDAVSTSAISVSLQKSEQNDPAIPPVDRAMPGSSRGGEPSPAESSALSSPGVAEPVPVVPPTTIYKEQSELDEKLRATQQDLEEAGETELTVDNARAGEVRGLCIVRHDWVAKRAWDFVIVGLAAISSIATPLQIGFDALEVGAFLYYSAAADVLFLIDLLMGFITSYTTSEGIEVLRFKKTARHYFTTWFIADLLSSIPFSLIALAGVSGASAATLNRILRILKLFKLARLLRIQRVFWLLDALVISDNPIFKVGPMLLGFLYYLHLASCFFYLASHSQATALGLENSTIVCPGVEHAHATLGARYSWAFSWTIALTLSSAFPFADTYARHAATSYDSPFDATACTADGVEIEDLSHSLVSTLLFLGIFVQAYIVCGTVSITAETRAMSSKRRERRARLKVLLHEKNVPLALRRDVLCHYDVWWSAEGDSHEWSKTVAGLSSGLKMKLLMHTHKSLLKRSSLFVAMQSASGGRKAMLIAMLEKMRTMVSTPMDVILHPGIVPPGLFVLSDGDCEVLTSQNRKIYDLCKGDFFGEELLTGEKAKAKVRARTACKMYVLLRTDFDEFLLRFPDLKHTVLRTKQKDLARRRHQPRQLARPGTFYIGRQKLKGIMGTMEEEESVVQNATFIKLPKAYDGNGEYDILLLRSEWLVERCRDGGRLERRQDLPAGAFYMGKLELRSVVVISYVCLQPSNCQPCHAPHAPHPGRSNLVVVRKQPWLTPEHPDPDCWHLQVLCELLRLFTDNYGEAAVFIDFCCLYQWPRDDEKEVRFRESLRGLKTLYAHQTTWVWALNVLPPGSTVRPYDLRGWPAYEMAISSWIKDPLKLLDISQLGAPLLKRLRECTSWHDDVHQRCIARRPQPLSPAAFDALLTSKVFSNGADQAIVSALYSDVFVEVFSQVRELDCSGVGWTDVDALIEALSVTSKRGEKVCPKLRYLWLFDNPIQDPVGALTRLRAAVGDACDICGLDPA